MQKQQNRILADMKSSAYFLNDVLDFCNWAPSTLKRKIAEKSFPKPVNHIAEKDHTKWYWFKEHIQTHLFAIAAEKFQEFQIAQSPQTKVRAQQPPKKFTLPS